MGRLIKAVLLIFISFTILSCGDDNSPENAPETVQKCVVEDDTEHDFLNTLGCESDFLHLASEPLDSSIPGARSAKIIIDRSDNNKLYFQNSKKYKIHWEFAREHLSGAGKPFVGELEQFNLAEYYSPDRRFILAALTRYEGPEVWALELSPYDTADADMIGTAYRAIAESPLFNDDFYFHPTSQSIELRAKSLPGDVKQISTGKLFEGIDYQPLNLAISYGKLRFIKSSKLDKEYVNFRDIVVLDKVPNDISVVSGIITAEFQTPLSHINVLSQNRGTPNMGLRDALSNKDLLALKDEWVKIEAKAFDWSIEKVTKEEADKWWDEHRPPEVAIPAKDLTRAELIDIGDVLNSSISQKEAIKEAIPSCGGKASHYAELITVEDLNVPKAFVIPIYYYDNFMNKHGFDKQIEALLADDEFVQNAKIRDKKLKELRDAMKKAELDEDFIQDVKRKIEEDFNGLRMRFRSSTNAEDLEGFTGAGLYTSKSGALNDEKKTIEKAIRKVWASVWYFRAFEERSYRGISHLDVGMALLVHRSFPDEYANGVALTSNPYDTSGMEPAFYINVQRGEASVVKPEAGVTTDQILYYFDRPGQPAIYLASSSVVPKGEHVLSDGELHELGAALKNLHLHFMKSYGPPADDPTKWYAMDVEFKFDKDEGGKIKLFVKQARPHSGRGK